MKWVKKGPKGRAMMCLTNIAVVCCCSVTQFCSTLQRHGPQHARLPSPSPTPGDCSRLMSIELVKPSNHLVLCHPLLLLIDSLD